MPPNPNHVIDTVELTQIDDLETTTIDFYTNSCIAIGQNREDPQEGVWLNSNEKWALYEALNEQLSHSDRSVCPECGNTETEFVQFASGEESTTETSPQKVGNGLLELRSCDDCGVGIEIVLTPETYTTVSHQ